MSTIFAGRVCGTYLASRYENPFLRFSIITVPKLYQNPRLHEDARLLAKGKELFLARCARCHDERGDKPLKTGPPLNERRLPTDEIARAVNGRLRDKTEEERRAVTLYISSLMKTKDSEEKAPPNP